MDRDLNPSFLDRFNRVAPIIAIFIAMSAAITGLVLYQSNLSSQIKLLEQKVDTFQQVMMARFDGMEARFDAMEEVFSTKVDYLEKKVDDNAEAIKQTLNEASQ